MKEVQTELFEKHFPKDDYLHRQLIKLGDMMGDGLHHEPGGRWIEKEYGKIARLIIPELAEQDKTRRKIKAARVDEQMAKILETARCQCSGELKQKRKGTKVCYCVLCGRRHVASKKKK